MVKSCLVATCKNTLGIPGITFHKIGKKKYADRLKAIGRSADECLSPQNVICSKHFAEEDFIHFNGKKYLRIEALPRFFVPRRPVVEQTTQIMTRPTSEPQNISYSTIDTSVLEDDVWVISTDVYLIPSQEDNIDEMMNEVNLSQYPTNEFLTSLLSEGCENLDFDMPLSPLIS